MIFKNPKLFSFCAFGSILLLLINEEKVVDTFHFFFSKIILYNVTEYGIFTISFCGLSLPHLQTHTLFPCREEEGQWSLTGCPKFTTNIFLNIFIFLKIKNTKISTISQWYIFYLIRGRENWRPWLLLYSSPTVMNIAQYSSCSQPIKKRLKCRSNIAYNFYFHTFVFLHS